MFTLRRQGTFEARLIPGTAHCGIKPENIFRYEVEVCVGDEALDDNGFVLDNAIVQQYFDRVYGRKNPTSRSCELIAQTAARDFYRILKGRGDHGHCKRICVRIFGIPTSHVEYEWENPNKVGVCTPM